MSECSMSVFYEPKLSQLICELWNEILRQHVQGKVYFNLLPVTNMIPIKVEVNSGKLMVVRPELAKGFFHILFIRVGGYLFIPVLEI